MKKCPSYDHAKKYADLFEKVGAKVKIEQIGTNKSIGSEQISSSKDQKVLTGFATEFLKKPQALLTGIVLLVVGAGVAYLLARIKT